MAKEKKTTGKKIRFLLSPTGAFGLAYNAGDEAEIDTAQADELVDAGYAQFVSESDGTEKTLTNEQKLQAEVDQLKAINIEAFKEIEALKAVANDKGVTREVPAGAVDSLTFRKLTDEEALNVAAKDKNTGDFTKAGEETLITGEGSQADIKLTKGEEETKA